MKYIITLLLTTGFTVAVRASVESDAGKNIFTTRCVACHAVDHDVVGPALKDIDKRRDEAWIIKFVHNSQEMVKSGDTAAVGIYNRKNQIAMPAHTDLSDQDIKNIIAYIKDESAKVATVAAAAFRKPFERKGSERPLEIKQWWIFLQLGIGIILLVYVLNLAINATSMANKIKGD